MRNQVKRFQIVSKMRVAFAAWPLLTLSTTLRAQRLNNPCEKAKTPVELIFCRDSSLKSKGQKLAVLYEGLVKGVKGEKAELLRRAERDWLLERDACLRKKGTFRRTETESIKNCLALTLDFRVAELETLTKTLPSHYDKSVKAAPNSKDYWPPDCEAPKVAYVSLCADAELVDLDGTWSEETTEMDKLKIRPRPEPLDILKSCGSSDHQRACLYGLYRKKLLEVYSTKQAWRTKHIPQPN